MTCVSISRPYQADRSPEQCDLLGTSDALDQIKTVARMVAGRHCTVLIGGQTGTGKEVMARYIHTHSDRRNCPFIPVNCSAISGTLFESELFGHTKGAFTGADRETLGYIRSADGGTLFLDEIGELQPEMQAKLLRVLQERRVTPVGDAQPRPVDVRIIAATNRDLREMVREGTFREDLYFRLCVVEMTMPALSDRREDIVPLAEYFLARNADAYQESHKWLGSDAASALHAYHWPGNVRELANVMERAHVLSTDECISLPDLPDVIAAAYADLTYEDRTDMAVGYDDEVYVPTLDQAQRQAIEAAMTTTDHCKAAAARLLDINVKRLNRLIDKLGVESHA